MSAEDRTTRASEHSLNRETQTQRVHELKRVEKTNVEIALALGLDESSVRTILGRDAEINWGYNCLTVGVHHGRPEAIWNLPLFQAAYMFSREDLEKLILSRIYHDAMQFVEHGVEVKQKETEAVWRLDTEWVEQVHANAARIYLRTLKHTVGEISTYYQSPECKRDQKEAVKRFEEGKLNEFYEPRHSYDSLNMFCRILGTKAYRAVS